LETPSVPGGGVKLPPPFCFITDDPCFLSIEPRHRTPSLCNAGELSGQTEVDDGRAPLDLDPAAAYRFAL
jgi:hypothetical protein